MINCRLAGARAEFAGRAKAQDSPLRVTILWSSLASYTVAFFRELALSENCRLQLVHQPPAPDTY